MSFLNATHKIKFTVDADGKPLTIVSAEKQTIVAGTLSALTTQFSEDEAVIGIGRIVATAATVYGGMVATNWKLTGGLRFNPFAVA
jgi:hypothetical protein